MTEKKTKEKIRGTSSIEWWLFYFFSLTTRGVHIEKVVCDVRRSK